MEEEELDDQIAIELEHPENHHQGISTFFWLKAHKKDFMEQNLRFGEKQVVAFWLVTKQAETLTETIV